MLNIQIQPSQMIIQTTMSQNTLINMFWWTRGPGIFWICNSHYILSDTRTNSILPSDNPSHKIPEHNN